MKSLKTELDRSQGGREPRYERDSVIKVLIVDDEPLMAAVMASALNSEDDITVVGTLTDADGAVEQARAEADVILVSTTLADDGAMRLVEAIAGNGHDTRVIVTGLGLSERDVLAYVESGADAYVLKESSIEDLLHSVRAAADGTALASPEIVRALMDRVSELVQLCNDAGIEIDGLPKLTDREEQILRLISQGKTNPEIAAECGVSVGTIKQHVHNILRKLNVSNRNEAARYFRLMTTLGVPDEF